MAGLADSAGRAKLTPREGRKAWWSCRADGRELWATRARKTGGRHGRWSKAELRWRAREELLRWDRSLGGRE
ncbi:hypothetical protein NL676_019720 [Syzygium grande]|nr:hypothetical protein NL676_019720 [Syzygium grande]